MLVLNHIRVCINNLLLKKYRCADYLVVKEHIKAAKIAVEEKLTECNHWHNLHEVILGSMGKSCQDSSFPQKHDFFFYFLFRFRML